jgi:hypothetical protein
MSCLDASIQDTKNLGIFWLETTTLAVSGGNTHAYKLLIIKVVDLGAKMGAKTGRCYPDLPKTQGQCVL